MYRLSDNIQTGVPSVSKDGLISATATFSKGQNHDRISPSPPRSANRGSRNRSSSPPGARALSPIPGAWFASHSQEQAAANSSSKSSTSPLPPPPNTHAGMTHFPLPPAPPSSGLAESIEKHTNMVAVDNAIVIPLSPRVREPSPPPRIPPSHTWLRTASWDRAEDSLRDRSTRASTAPPQTLSWGGAGPGAGPGGGGGGGGYGPIKFTTSRGRVSPERVPQYLHNPAHEPWRRSPPRPSSPRFGVNAAYTAAQRPHYFPSEPKPQLTMRPHTPTSIPLNPDIPNLSPHSYARRRPSPPLYRVRFEDKTSTPHSMLPERKVPSTVHHHPSHRSRSLSPAPRQSPVVERQVAPHNESPDAGGEALLAMAKDFSRQRKKEKLREKEREKEKLKLKEDKLFHDESRRRDDFATQKQKVKRMSSREQLIQQLLREVSLEPDDSSQSEAESPLDVKPPRARKSSPPRASRTPPAEATRIPSRSMSAFLPSSSSDEEVIAEEPKKGGRKPTADREAKIQEKFPKADREARIQEKFRSIRQQWKEELHSKISSWAGGAQQSSQEQSEDEPPLATVKKSIHRRRLS